MKPPCTPPPANTPKERLDNRFHEFMHTHRNTMRRYFQSCGMFNGHPRILFHLRHTPGMTQKELADTLGVAAATLSVSIRRLEAAGLVERRADEQDARRFRLYLTPHGEEVETRCAKGRDFFIEAVFTDFSDEDVAALDALLTRMTDNLTRAANTLPPITDEKEDTP